MARQDCNSYQNFSFFDENSKIHWFSGTNPAAEAPHITKGEPSGITVPISFCDKDSPNLLPLIDFTAT
ncbi:MAG TPA: hypothetical protein DCM07_02085 [Planctomycetaceae bacterium]|nr:hypothetical protein [Gimesia sp.]HAH43643.1 hypothetical protein [Planctomycetaceae bacterium]HBL48229.1 hypothetical protein [Planctomycetaceae bacterium]|tara:strand:+ start:835 stop:1038 length:204 start_codon:yes stop_codon:yes gene_type:complete